LCITIIITSEHIGVVATVYSHFLIFKKFKLRSIINIKLFFKIVIKCKIKKIRYVQKKLK